MLCLCPSAGCVPPPETKARIDHWVEEDRRTKPFEVQPCHKTHHQIEPHRIPIQYNFQANYVLWQLRDDLFWKFRQDPSVGKSRKVREESNFGSTVPVPTWSKMIFLDNVVLRATGRRRMTRQPAGNASGRTTIALSACSERSTLSPVMDRCFSFLTDRDRSSHLGQRLWGASLDRKGISAGREVEG